MKSIRLGLLIGLSILTGNLFAQEKGEINLADSTGLPGDNFSLEGALGVFKESKSLEEFEKAINSKEKAINNLDLNNDGKVDYIRVVADMKGENHIVMLKIPVSKTESQDVAVIEIEKNGDNSAYLQILGDPILYGDTQIVEPLAESEPADPGVMRKGPAAFSPAVAPFYVNVWFWPCVRFMYAPAYIVYVSPWYWDFYPGWWDPWYPYPWRYHYMHTWHYHHHFHQVYDHHCNNAHQIYAPRRSSSTMVENRYQARINDYRASHPNRPRPNMNQGRPESKPVRDVRSKPEVRPNEQPRQKPEVRPAPNRPTRPQTQPEPRPMQQQPQTKPGIKQPDRDNTRPVTRPREKQKPSPQIKPQQRNQSQSKPSPRQQRNPK